MSHFNSPAEVLAYANRVAAEDIQRWRDNNVELNPFCTQQARDSWQRGYDNAGPRSYENTLDFDTIYQRGAACRRLLEQ